jgi:hypothetical protein
MVIDYQYLIHLLLIPTTSTTKNHTTHTNNIPFSAPYITEVIPPSASVNPDIPHQQLKMSLKRKNTSMCSEYSDSDDGLTDPLHGGDRKRKRGQIEKKRRDRINDCVNEIKDLVPTAMEKSTVHKLEKAEILQMTVDHLKTVQNNPDRNRSMVEHQNGGSVSAWENCRNIL